MAKTYYPKEIQKLFSQIVEEVKNTLNPEYIIIAGSFGKGSWLYNDSNLLSDFEFEFICAKKWSINKKRKLLKSLNQRFDVEINLKGHLLKNVVNKISSNYSNSYPDFLRLNYFDAFFEPEILYARKSTGLNIDIHIKEVPTWEAWRFYINRIGDLLSLNGKNSGNLELDNYYWLKMFETMADAYLIINNLYSKNISKRFHLFTKKLIQKDPNLNEQCIESFDTIHSALNARKEHDLSVFKNSFLDAGKKFEIVNSWLSYFEFKLSEEEGFSSVDTSFTLAYLNDKSLQKKYLEVNNQRAATVSNVIRFVFNYKLLLSLNFKIFNLNKSWRHLILNVISSLYKEKNDNKIDFPETRMILSSILPTKSLNEMKNEQLIDTVLKLWKILR